MFLQMEILAPTNNVPEGMQGTLEPENEKN